MTRTRTSKEVARSFNSRPSTHPQSEYARLLEIDGSHPMQKLLPESHIMYPVRQLDGGEVAYFNFNLAKEMGLIASDHPHVMTQALAQMLVSTFCLRIINEYDQIKGKSYPKPSIKQNKYMATRYLQLQHSDKRGLSSGDGRSIWNGMIRHRGRAWDVSSRGTGVTSLSPGANQAQRPLRSGDTRFGYGCGMADIDELYGSAILSEIFHHQGLKTERVLCIIDLGKGKGIGVRAAPNLLRPSHQFLFLKQRRRRELATLTDMVIRRQFENGEWSISPQDPKRWELMISQLSESFADLSAYLERFYIFAWLEWDGDNCLTSGGLIDYGSVRQFGLRHDQYRYDDVDRFSTNLNGQVAKARLMIQTYLQLVEFLETGRTKKREFFKDHVALKFFDQRYRHHLKKYFLQQMGFDDIQAAALMENKPSQVRELYRLHVALEKVKRVRRFVKVADGINRPALFNMGRLLRELSRNLDRIFSIGHNAARIPALSPRPEITVAEVFEWMLSTRGLARKKKWYRRIRPHLERYLELYLDLVRGSGIASRPGLLQVFAQRASQMNRADRMTGNAAIHIVEEIIKARKSGVKHEVIQEVIDHLTHSHKARRTGGPRLFDLTSSASKPKASEELLLKISSILFQFSEDI